MDKKKRPNYAIQSSTIARARKALKHWYADQGRHHLAWRLDPDPYRVLVSEFMLQLTTVNAVTPRFHDWMSRFPTIQDLALASEQEVLSAWEGLGYYSRARRLHAAARLIVECHGSKVPKKEAELLALPGIGTYTAAAIRAFAHDLPAVVLDTNIIRVLSRWGNMVDPIDTAKGRIALESIASSFFSKSGCRAIASALMDLGATLCKAGKPDCTACPLQKTCEATSPENLPKKSPRHVTTKLTENRAWIHLRGKLHLEQSEGPHWRGLWILPVLGTDKPSGPRIAEITYQITRYRVTMKLFPVNTTLSERLTCFTQKEIESLPIPTPHRKAIEEAFRAIAKG